MKEINHLPIKFAFILWLGLFSIILYAQDTGKKTTELSETKTGWNFGALPTITFDSDLGFQYGALVNLYDYGNGSRYPRYNHSLYFEVSRFTKGSGINRFFYDSDQLLKGIRTTFDLSFLTDQKMDFFGFNGYESSYNPSWVDDQDMVNYHTRMFYAYDRKMLRIKVDLQKQLGNSNFWGVAGLALYNIQAGPIDLAKLNKGKADDKKLPDTDVLYDKYVNWGIISPEEKDGGWLNYLKAGISYDSRDNEPNPMKGIWTEAVIQTAPGFLGNGSFGHTKFAIIHRQYFTLIKRDLSFAYRLAYQGTLGGKVPFYSYPLMMTTFMKGAYSEGLGGAKTLRGILRDRIVGKGFVYGNAELRWKFVHTRFLNQNLYLALNAFWDGGMVVQKVDVNTSGVILAPDEEMSDYFSNKKESLHSSVGGGLRVAMNENFIISFDFGKALDPQDGTTGIYIGLNYLF
ncbi:MAG: BamA/TamA family outer membrane protein [Chlorobi bacterium]|nr:BamA/TamA family outer membrane protein [Chlorobiota bacterium]